MRGPQTPPEGWVVPDGYTPTSGLPAACKSCRARILWCRTTAGNLAPLNYDGINHFATCPQARDWRRR